MMKSSRPTVDRLRELLTYSPETGELRWLRPRTGLARKTSLAGGRLSGRVMIDTKFYRTTHVMWAIATGGWPTGVIDHINGDCKDNRLVNLRDVPVKINAQNRISRKPPSSGFQGVYYKSRIKKYQAMIGVGGRLYGLGCYTTAEQAHAAYLAAKAKYHEGFVPSRFKEK